MSIEAARKAEKGADVPAEHRNRSFNMQGYWLSDRTPDGIGVISRNISNVMSDEDRRRLKHQSLEHAPCESERETLRASGSAAQGLA
jgi:hypothetical protein